MDTEIDRVARTLKFFVSLPNELTHENTRQDDIGLVPLVLASGEPGKELLYPVATVILGGLISSTVLDFFVHPAMFWLFGMKEAQRVIEESTTEIEFEEVSHEPSQPRMNSENSTTIVETTVA